MKRRVLLAALPAADLRPGQTYALTLQVADAPGLAIPVQVTMRAPAAAHGATH